MSFTNRAHLSLVVPGEPTPRPHGAPPDPEQGSPLGASPGQFFQQQEKTLTDIADRLERLAERVRERTEDDGPWD